MHFGIVYSCAFALSFHFKFNVCVLLLYNTCICLKNPTARNTEVNEILKVL